MPLTCDRDCASEFLPFYRACHDKVQFGTDKSAFSGFDDTCRAAWVASGAAKNTQISGCNMAELKKTCPTQELMLGIKYTSVDALCSSDCATKVSGQFDSCEARPAKPASTRILHHTAPCPPFLISHRVPHDFTQDPSTGGGFQRVFQRTSSISGNGPPLNAKQLAVWAALRGRTVSYYGLRGVSKGFCFQGILGGPSVVVNRSWPSHLRRRSSAFSSVVLPPPVGPISARNCSG